MSNYWYRVWNGTPEDGKWRTLARLAEVRVADILAVNMYLWDRASRASDRGSIAGADSEIMSDVLGIDANAIERIRTQMNKMNLITPENRISSWEKYQPLREDGSAERAKAWRENKKKLAQATENIEDGQNTPKNRTHVNATERNRTLDTDTDKIRIEEVYIADSVESAKSAKKSKDENLYTEDFNDFWEVYPSNGRAKGSKHGAAKAYAKAIKITQHQNIIEGVKSYETLIRNSGQLNADAVTWLNQQRWADDNTAIPIIKPIATPQHRASAWEHNVGSGFQAAQYYRERATLERQPESAFG